MPRRLRACQKPRIHTRQELLGESAIRFVDEIESSPPPKGHVRIKELSDKEITSGFAGRFWTRWELDQQFGAGNWRPLLRFLIHKPKDRCIDDGRRSGHNGMTSHAETIYTTGVEFILATVKRIILWVLYLESGIWNSGSLAAREVLPEWVSFQLGLDDMLDAYRQVPVEVGDQPLTFAAVYVESEQQWRYLDLWGVPCGLLAVVTVVMLVLSRSVRHASTPYAASRACCIKVF